MENRSNHKPQKTSSTNNENRGFKGIVQSTFAAFFGVQSEKNRQKDFQTGRLSDYIFAGIVGTFLLLFGMAFLVSQILSDT